MSKSEQLFADKYLQCKEVAKEDCYMGGKNCGTCTHCREYDSKFNFFKHSYCTCAERKGA